MNPQDLSATELVVWGIVIHLVADWVFQNDWMAVNKYSLKHPAGYAHATIHGLLLSSIFGWVALPLAVAHLLIDTRLPVKWWSKLIRQTQPSGRYLSFPTERNRSDMTYFPLWDAGTEVSVWEDQVFHIVCIVIAAVLVA